MKMKGIVRLLYLCCSPHTPTPTLLLFSQHVKIKCMLINCVSGYISRQRKLQIKKLLAANEASLQDKTQKSASAFHSWQEANALVQEIEKLKSKTTEGDFDKAYEALKERIRGMTLQMQDGDTTSWEDIETLKEKVRDLTQQLQDADTSSQKEIEALEGQVEDLTRQLQDAEENVIYVDAIEEEQNKPYLQRKIGLDNLDAAIKDEMYSRTWLLKRRRSIDVSKFVKLADWPGSPVHGWQVNGVSKNAINFCSKKEMKEDLRLLHSALWREQVEKDRYKAIIDELNDALRKK